MNCAVPKAPCTSSEWHLAFQRSRMQRRVKQFPFFFRRSAMSATLPLSTALACKLPQFYTKTVDQLRETFHHSKKQNSFSPGRWFIPVIPTFRRLRVQCQNGPSRDLVSKQNKISKCFKQGKKSKIIIFGDACEV